MNYKVSTLLLFEKQVKRLSKKYPSIKKDLEKLVDSLMQVPEQGTALGNNFYKIRIAITSKNKGKSGGARVITYLKIIENTVYLTSIYDKSERANISDDELRLIFNQLP